MDDESRYRALGSRDPRFDGVFFVGVTSTGIYCRPSCPATTPRREHVTFHRSAAAAQLAGFRACKRCRPDAVPGSPEWNVRTDLVGRAMRLIAEGVVDRDGVRGLAARLGYSERQLHRALTAEVGAGPLALARAQRAQTARLLLESTALPVAEVAFAAGFSSVRQCNDTVRAVYAMTPTQLRRAAAATGLRTPGALSLRLPYRPPLHAPTLFGFLAKRAMPGVEEVADGVYRRAIALPHGEAVVEVALGTGDGRSLRAGLRLEDVRDVAPAVQALRRLFDLDADTGAVDEALGDDPGLRPLVTARPGLRAPAAADPHEAAVRAVLGQQVSVAGATTIAGRLAERYGKPLAAPVGGVLRRFPAAEALAEADPADLPMPAARKRALFALCRALADGDLALDPGADRGQAEAALLALPGIGPWTAAAIRMRALGDPDVFLASDLGVRQAMERLGLPADPRGAEARAERWRPWRSYALAHLWAFNAERGGSDG